MFAFTIVYDDIHGWQIIDQLDMEASRYQLPFMKQILIRRQAKCLGKLNHVNM